MNSPKFSTNQMEVVAKTISQFKQKIGFNSADPVQVEFFANLEVSLCQAMGGNPTKFAVDCMPPSKYLFDFLEENLKQQLKTLTVSQIQAMIQTRVDGIDEHNSEDWITIQGKGYEEPYSDNDENIPF